MKCIAVSVVLMFVAVITEAQQTLKFDFGNGRVKKGYTAVTPESKFANEKGYGFTAESEVTAVDRGGKSVNDDYITSSKPFYFSVNLPDGNYDVKIILGDKKGTSATTVRAECRRLFLENIRTAKGKFVTETFTVNVRDSLIRDEKGNIVKAVRLKPREYNYLHWDNFLTIEFNDSLPKVCAIEITPNKTAPTIFLAGNSTVVDQDKEPWAAWGQMIPRFFAPGKAAVANYAESGEALNSFLSARRLEKILSLMKPGDYLFIEFGHNDMKQKGPGIGPFTSYKKLLKQYIAEVKKKAGIPVLVTSMHRRNFDKDGKIINTLLEYPEAVRQTAKEENVAVIDLNAMSKVLYEAWGPIKSIKAFVHFPANTFPGQTTKLEDNTHFSTYGAYELAKCIVKSIKDQNLPLAQFLRTDIAVYDPASPATFESFYWPMSSFLTSTKPDGN
ncbi:lysophospholipase L1-like esterase [Lacibacter cauensis]|uniref:Lysophospholipase L1-like esterase n=1 Tax=Lacibacter cauensis TaxID=510947 RepID=A0A562SWE7_9BACT|nr:GDSL-type esterase/lipase family protein [Lacibacter cauensis]TWI85627.1 lysophospholipase L1-like esterase [Lacibacter cauensis]